MVVLLLVGWITFYNSGVMEEVYAGRLVWDARIQPCNECIGLATIPDPIYLGRRIWLKPVGRQWEGPFLVVDCGVPLNPEHIAEVAKVTAKRWGMRQPILGYLRFDDPYEDCSLNSPC